MKKGFDEDKFIKEEVAKAISRVEEEQKADRNIKCILDFLKERKFNLNHPDVPEDLRNYIYDLMNRWPRVSFVEHCLITNLFTIREDPNTTYEINPKEEKDVSIGDIDVLNNIE